MIEIELFLSLDLWETDTSLAYFYMGTVHRLQIPMWRKAQFAPLLSTQRNLLMMLKILYSQTARYFWLQTSIHKLYWNKFALNAELDQLSALSIHL